VTEDTATMQWSVGVEVAGDEVMTIDRIADLADAVAPAGGIASGIGQAAYGVKVLVEAAGRDEAVAKATAILRSAAVTASLPEWPVARVEAVSEADEEEE
jgi:hypothetical protein